MKKKIKPETEKDLKKAPETDEAVMKERKSAPAMETAVNYAEEYRRQTGMDFVTGEYVQ